MNSSKNKLNSSKNKLNSKKKMSFSSNCHLTFPPHYQNQPIIKIFKQIGKLGTQLGD